MSRWDRPGFEDVLAFFDGDVRKAHAWYGLRNPGLGYSTPAWMISVGRDASVRRLIADAMRANRTAEALR